MPRIASRLSLWSVVIATFVGAAAASIACDSAGDDATPVACRAQSYRYSQYTGANYDCHCHDEEFAGDEDPGQVCRDLYDELFSASYSAGGSHDREFSFVVAAPGRTCDEVVVDPCDNTDI